MGAWGTKDDVPKLVKLLDQLDSLIRMAAIEALGKIKDPASAEALAPLLANQSDQHNAARALEALGEIAEPAVIKMLHHADKQVRYHACKTLGKVGGKRSVAAIKKQLRAERDNFARLGAEGALRDLQKRGF
jgi:HEAT repeat protein